MDSATAILIDGGRMFGLIEAGLWTALRVGSALMAAPLIGSRMVPARIRVVLAMTLAAAMTPMLPAPPAMAIDAATLLSVVRELALGISLGFIMRLAFEAGALAGELIAQGMALSFAQMADPLRGGVNSGLLGQWFNLALGLFFFAFDVHLALIALIAESYRAAPVGAPLGSLDALLSTAPGFLTTVFRIGALIALPAMIAMLVINLSFGLLARAAPALNPIALGLPAALLAGLVLLTVQAGELAGPARALFDEALAATRGLLG
jgi:flagellar biosynthetic protein FliR